LLRNVVLEHEYVDRSSSYAEHLVCEAEQCFRCARSPGLKEVIATGLEAAGHEFMARAVDIETSLQRERRKRIVMTSGEIYRTKAAEFRFRAQHEAAPRLQAELQGLALAYLRLAEEADRNELVGLADETLPRDAEPDAKD
jgi:hypothetical protein